MRVCVCACVHVSLSLVLSSPVSLGHILTHNIPSIKLWLNAECEDLAAFRLKGAGKPVSTLTQDAEVA